ncbi:L-lactate permease, partial [Staphylococcus pseudintermedius]|uniref:L-lactate permease n=1 Tax=Staphylococcus pseudintermedius TaxID=283734 RepID=UPI000E379688
RPLVSVSTALIAESISVSLGAVGTPVIVGLSTLKRANEQLYFETAIHITKIDLFSGVFIPMIIVTKMIIFFWKSMKLNANIEIFPWTLL